MKLLFSRVIFAAALSRRPDFFPPKAQDLAQWFDNRRRITPPMQYRLPSRSAEGRGQFHSVRLRVKRRTNVTVRARKGYYAPKP
jgi:hypothetical protein